MAGLSAYQAMIRPQQGYARPQGKPSLQYMARRRDQMRKMGLLGPEPPTPLEQAAIAEKQRAQEEQYTIDAEKREVTRQGESEREQRKHEAEQQRLKLESDERIAGAKQAGRARGLGAPPALPGKPPTRAPGDAGYGIGKTGFGAGLGPQERLAAPPTEEERATLQAPDLPRRGYSPAITADAEELNMDPSVVADLTGNQRARLLRDRREDVSKAEAAGGETDALIGELAGDFLADGLTWEQARLKAQDAVESGFTSEQLEGRRKERRADDAKAKDEWGKYMLEERKIAAKGKEARKTGKAKKALEKGPGVKRVEELEKTLSIFMPAGMDRRDVVEFLSMDSIDQSQRGGALRQAGKDAEADYLYALGLASSRLRRGVKPEDLTKKVVKPKGPLTGRVLRTVGLPKLSRFLGYE